jgi:hypothetical protein
MDIHGNDLTLPEKRTMEWDPTQFFREDEDMTPPPFALVVLNQPINEIALSVLREHGMSTYTHYYGN